ncbi:DUF3747 domain-containing protein [Kamptonema animale CS-326]|jgi:N-acetylmuramoyl-L-alanine amidase|uniref:DUF3747 domain-containing protein n=1 Tax=Kamptonema animale TaxID=92934 RepID=UPI00232E184D|nr:DUF3747 domain-containing protein [Kamptonema animale]MDB9513313.1 DUF3747 domain-containing protein [Kamptonema animale CS-326]
MNILRRLAMAAFGTAAIFTINTLNQAAAAYKFDQTEIDQNSVVAVAVPRGLGGHQLLVLEQISKARSCWSESGSNPVTIDPLLLNFDFTGLCGRATDSNGYSIRMAGTDLALKYSLSLQNNGSDVLLVGSPNDPNYQPVVIGRTRGVTSGFMKVFLDPEWRFAKRAYDGKTLGHFYLASNQTAPGTVNNGTDTPPITTAFKDISSDIYSKEIQQAVDLGFVAGFSDNTFRPQEALTREQLVSLVLESLKRVKGANLNIPTQVSSRPYADVEASRWSAAKIKFAQDNKIVSGYEDGTFKPQQLVTRAEMMAVLRKAAEFGLTLQGQSPNLSPTQPIKTFSDTPNHWAASTINQMSGYCSVASPLNESGNQFFPDAGAKRNYAAAATLRMLNCVSK